MLGMKHQDIRTSASLLRSRFWDVTQRSPETFNIMSPACSFIFMQIKVIFAPRLALKQKHKGTQKWPITRSFQLKKSLWRRNISFFNLLDKGLRNQVASLDLLTASFEYRSFLLFSICTKLSALDWRLQLDISRKNIFSHQLNIAMGHEALVLGAFIRIFYSFVMIAARGHSQFLVACVRRETKARNLSSFAPQAFLCEILRHSHFAIIMIMWLVCLTECKQTTNKTKRMWFGCEQPFL